MWQDFVMGQSDFMVSLCPNLGCVAVPRHKPAVAHPAPMHSSFSDPAEHENVTEKLQMAFLYTLSAVIHFKQGTGTAYTLWFTLRLLC